MPEESQQPSPAEIYTWLDRDISERQQAEESLRLFQFLSDNANDAFFVFDEAGYYVYVNEAACRSLGYAAAEFRRLRPFDIDPLHDEAQCQAFFRCRDSARLPTFESIHRRSDGTTFPIEASVTRLYVGGRALLFSSCRDITERKAAEKELRIRADQEALLNLIGQAVLPNADPATLQAMALTLLGQKLAVDRCFYVLYDEDRNKATVEKDWCREGIASLEGEWDLTEHGMVIMDIYAGGRTVVVEDVASASLPPGVVELFLQTGQRSYIAVPFFDEGRLWLRSL